jgi:hypothetical protein
VSTPRSRKRSGRKRSGRKRSSSPRKSSTRRRKASTQLKTLLTLIIAAVVIGAGVAGGGLDYLEELFDGDSAGAGTGSGWTRGELDADKAREQLAELQVAEWASMRGYSRDRFSHWRTVDGCDARQTVLARDGDDVEVAENCRVTSGTWFSPFDGVTLTDPGDIDIDHLVPLANAWRTGAAAWEDDRRADFANDLDTPQLIAVSASSNRSKGDQDPSQWQPVREYWCQYAHDWIVVKHHWELWVTQDERDTLEDMLDTC